MAKYSEQYRLANSDWHHPKPHILYRDNCYWDYVFTSKAEHSDKNDMADQFCQKLNNAAPKRGLKA